METLVNLVQKGLLGKIKHAHAWSNRPIWPQGITRPPAIATPPETLDWNLWLGVAPTRPFAPGVYQPFKWRGWYDFGTGALGDMGCHILDPIYWALELTAPTTILCDCLGVVKGMRALLKGQKPHWEDHRDLWEWIEKELNPYPTNQSKQWRKSRRT